MSKWKCGICGSEFENYHAQGFDDTIYCPLCYFKKLYKDTELERETLQTQLQQKENKIKEVREYINNHQLVFEMSSKKQIAYWFDMFYKELLEILDKGE